MGIIVNVRVNDVTLTYTLVQAPPQIERLQPHCRNASETGSRRLDESMTKREYAPFDAADYLNDLEDVAGYLELALEESAEDPSAVPRALGVIARSQNMSELARRVGMSRDGLYKALSDDGNPTWSTIVKVTNALGLRFELHSVA